MTIRQKYNARLTVIEMLEDRGYIVPKEYKEVDLDTYRYLYNNKNIDMFVDKHKTEDKKIYVKCTFSNLKPSIIKDYIHEIEETYIHNPEDKLLFILNDKPNNSILKIPLDPEYNRVEINWIDNLQFNITKHRLVPKHELLEQTDLEILMEKYQITNLTQFPVILKTDAIIKYYDFKPGNVCKITRPSPTSLNHVYYRYIK